MLINNKNINLKKININYNKININNLFLYNKIVIFINCDNPFYLKNDLLNFNIKSVILKKKYIKALFNLKNFFFLEGESFFCVFLNDINFFFNLINKLDNKEFFYIYKNSLSNYYIVNETILSEYKTYNRNFFLMQFFLIKKKLKIFLLLYFLLLSILKVLKI